jgi:Zn-dependent protease with chaperone function
MESDHVRRARMARLEQAYDAAPGRYHLRLALLAALGYLVMGAALLLTAGVALVLVFHLLFRPGGDGWILMPILLLGLTGAVLARALWIRFVPPEGYALADGEAPALRAEVERIRQAVGAQRLHGIVIDAQLNAAAAHVPVGFGLWRPRHYLVIGLPLLQLLDREELASVIAHEFGHFHDERRRFSSWIYRSRVGWYRVLEGLSRQALGSQVLLLMFFRWYARCFDEHSFVLARRQEYAADAAARAVAGTTPTATALVRVALASDWLARGFWPEVERTAHAQAYPPVHVGARQAEGLAAQRQQHTRLPAWLLTHVADPDDTHPGLAQRLAALDAGADLRLDGTRPPAAAELLGVELVERLEQRFSREWQAAAKPAWEARHRRLQAERQRLDALESDPRRSPAEWLEYAALMEEHRPGSDAAPLYREAVRQSPTHAVAHGRLGLLLLRQGSDEEGIEHLQRAMRLDAALAPLLLRDLDEHVRTRPPGSPLHATATRLREAFEAGPAAAHGDGAEDDVYSPHGLDASQLQAIRRVLAGYERIASAWVVRRKAPDLSVEPHFVVLLEWAGSVASETAAVPRLTAQLALPGTFTVLTTTRRTPELRQLRSRAGEPVHQRR